MRLFLILPTYIRWHYLSAPQAIVRITGNFVWFLWHFFSVGLLAGTLISPWERIRDVQEKKFNLEAFLSSAVVNGMMRVVGVLIRSVFIVVGMLAIVGTLILGVIGLVVWVALPAVVVFCFVAGVIFISKPV